MFSIVMEEDKNHVLLEKGKSMVSMEVKDDNIFIRFQGQASTNTPSK